MEERNFCEGRCPKCGSSKLEWYDSGIEGGSYYGAFECKSCGCQGKEWYDLVYSETIFNNNTASMSIEAIFKKQMAEYACDLAEILFNSEEEKTAFINKAWTDYGDDIEEHVIGEIGVDFSKQNDDVKEKLVIEAIKDNFEGIFGVKEDAIFEAVKNM